jgi:2-keto-4-pentenoate hydratase/2-oxohepta-3-ene-1,7-dioic acid hydratase in catechol pathway
MTRHVRFTLDSTLPVYSPDQQPNVRKGLWNADGLFQGQDGIFYKPASVWLLPPVAPSKIVCVGRNYADHAKELGNAVPEEPIIFLKPPSSLNAHKRPVYYPRLSKQISFEGELGLVIGRRARFVSAAGAWDFVAGFTIVNDFTARDLQKKDGQWTRGKGFDSFCPIGPCWVPLEEVAFESLRVITRVNGEVRQDAPVTDMLFPPGAILQYVSSFMTLEPGDVIATGTPPGVGLVSPGDRVEVEIPGLGILENTIEPEPDPNGVEG